MHPADVAFFVEEQVAILKEKAVVSDLPITSITLAKQVELSVEIQLTQRARISTIAPNGGILVGAGMLDKRHNVLLTVPDLSVRPVTVTRIVFFELSDFDSIPPTAELLDASRSPLRAHEWPTELTGRGLVNGHPDYPRPWFCRAGFREYHSHPEHADDPWDIHREDAPLHGLVLGLVQGLVNRSF